MANEASPQELKELEEILKNNPELHFSLQALTEIWQQSPATDRNEIESAYQNHLNRMQSELTDHPGYTEDFVENSTLFSSSRNSFLRRNLLAITAFGVAVILTAGAVFYSIPAKKDLTESKPKTPVSEISTRYGSRTYIILPDGSKVWLNAGSKITYDKTFGEMIRNVKLTGEAYFDVVHNAEKPFVIHTTTMDIKVLGTEFNVKSYPDESTTEASLIRGSIEVTLNDKRAEKILMKPNEKLVVKNNATEAATTIKPAKNIQKEAAPIVSLIKVKYSSVDSAIVETSWVNNRLIFEDESFEEIATKMSRWYNVDFEFGNDEIQRLRFTGNIKNESVEDALKAMQISVPFGFRMSSEKHILITKN